MEGSNTTRGITRWIVALTALTIGLLGIHRLFIKASLPLQVRSFDNRILVTENYGEGVHVGDQILAIDGTTVNTESQIEFLLDGRRIGASIPVSLFDGERTKEVITSLVASYPTLGFPIICLLIGLAFWGTAAFVMMKKPHEEAPSVLYGVLLLFSLAIMTSAGNYAEEPVFVGYLTRAAGNISYVGGIAAFVHFSMVFPQRRWRNLKLFSFALYSIAVLIASALVTTESLAIARRSIDWAASYHGWQSILRGFLLLGVVGGLLNLLYSSRRAQAEAERRKTEWILWGAAVGASPFLFLQIVPQLFGSSMLIPEEFSMAFLLIIPISFSIAVLKYHVFDIEVIIRRSIVYALLTGLVVGMYFLVIAAGTTLLQGIIGDPGKLVSLIAAFSIALLFNPIRRRVQNFVDRTFYRVQYDFREAVKSLNNEIKETVTLNQLAQLVIERIDSLIPVEKIALIVVAEPGHRMKVIAHRGLDVAAKHIPSLRVEEITTDLTLPVARPEIVEPGIPIDVGMAHVFERWGISVALPLTILAKQIVGVIVLGDKRSALRYSVSDLDLLMTLASHIALAVERLQLQEQLIIGEIENKRLEELNALKSEFVSSVSHELRTPLTSIQMFAETLLSRNIKSEKKRKEYLRIIQGESERLTRLINNVLDFSKIERGVKQYNFDSVNVRDLLRDVLKTMEYQFDKRKFKVNARVPKTVPLIKADRDAVAEAIINLLSNAIKYSGIKKRIDIRMRSNTKHITIEVRDYGIGIPRPELENIFEKFYRVLEGTARHASGAGLGLALVKHIMDAHGGEVKVQSEVGKGSTFTLVFSVRRNKLSNKRSPE